LNHDNVLFESLIINITNSMKNHIIYRKIILKFLFCYIIKL